MAEGGRPDFFPGGAGTFPRQLPDNCVEYVLVIIDSQIENRKLLSELEHVRKLALQLRDRLAGDYIWQRDEFQLQVTSKNGLHYLQGTTNYGDSVEDEWLIVFLLRELTKSRPDLWARVADSDGEFLLIEAANVVPRWLSPEIDGNRAWIHQGHLKIITSDETKSPKRPLSLVEAVQILQYSPELVEHHSVVEEEAFYRLAKYPQQITYAIHFSVVTIPRKLAHLIHLRPSTIASAVEAFYTRNPVSLKLLDSDSAHLHFPPEDLVSVSVKFTKVLFAQLKSQQFAPPAAWAKTIQMAEAKAEQAETAKRDLDRLETGMKLTSGYEILASSATSKDSRLVREFAILLDDLETDMQQDGIGILPSNETMLSWPHGGRDDDESWLDINFEDFEHELDGKKRQHGGDKSGFGSATAHADLQKIVSRFESFLNDESAGIEGAQVEDMDEDDDELSDSQESDTETDDIGVQLDEARFASMMRDMMGISTGVVHQEHAPENLSSRRRQSVGSDDLDDMEIQELSAQMQAELDGHGALRLDHGSPEVKMLERGMKQGGDQDDDSRSSDDEALDIDYNLAKNLLESFKSQAGLAGPAGNILGMMGMQLPRDEQEHEHQSQTE
ncbi:SGT1 protein-domain-containing protein [Microdochium trichocladiopsis]|uniref:SGT1 protein-domain-containing protein n=1 Tax=Microdochium trichocladiopsis TaxID=1682393 RepID=A0A9P8Y449_9PEZI|nr:SGT1 protein-domain-containing protein [Microdochium trichocladiopsis]KAH7029373.1 SGT1 protein-domain-containing protein [Microdochium trichocladiopsis]